MSEDITYCFNRKCNITKCERNPKHIKSPHPHSFAIFTDCPYWDNECVEWRLKIDTWD